MTRGKIRGFSLLELLVGLGLLIILLGLSFYRFKSTGGDSKAAANIMAAELKAARQLARSSNEPVAVAFPTTPDSVPHATGFLILQGWTQPRPHRGFSLQTDAEDTYIFTGYWTGPDWRLGLERADLDAPNFVLADWGAPSEFHYIVFLPSGVVETDLPTFEGACHLVALNGLLYDSGAVQGVTRFQLASAGDPYTVRVQANGSISVIKGVVDGIVPGTAPGTLPAEAAAVTVPAEPSNSGPSAEAFIFPGPHPTYRPAGADATVKLDGFSTLRVEATDPQGDRLYCEWTCDQGVFSVDGPVEMTWNSDKKVWESTHQWQPPDEAESGDQFSLEYRVFDTSGAEATGTFGVQGVVEVLPRGRILFQGKLDPGDEGNLDIFVINSDGTDLTQLTKDPAHDLEPTWSPDGSRIAFHSYRDEEHAIYTMNPDGSNVTRIIGEAELNAEGLRTVWNTEPRFDPTGTMLCFAARSSSTDELNIFAINIDGTRPTLNPSTLQPLGFLPSPGSRLVQLGVSGMLENGSLPQEQRDALDINDWHGGGRYILVSAGRYQQRPDSDGLDWDYLPEDVYLVDTQDTTGLPGSGYTNLTATPGQVSQDAHFHPLGDGTPNGDIIYFYDETSYDDYDIFQGTIDLSAAVPSFGSVSAVAGNPAGTAFSPDGIYLLGGYHDAEISLVAGGSYVRLTDSRIGRGAFSWAIDWGGLNPPASP